MTKGSDQIKDLDLRLWTHQTTYRELGPRLKPLSNKVNKEKGWRGSTSGIPVHHSARKRSFKQAGFN